MAENKEFLVSVSDCAIFSFDPITGKDILVGVGTACLNTSIEVSMDENEINAGKGNALQYVNSYGRQLSATIEHADFNLDWIAIQVGTEVAKDLNDAYKMKECYTVDDEGKFTLSKEPIGDVNIQTSTGERIQVAKEDITSRVVELEGHTNERVYATYQYATMTKRLVIDSKSTTGVYKLVLDNDICSNDKGKSGTLQIVIPRFKPDGNFTLSLTPDGVASTEITGKALEIEGACGENPRYAYIDQIDDASVLPVVTEIAVLPSKVTLAVDEEYDALRIIGFRDQGASNISIDKSECSFTSDTISVATCVGGLIKGISEGDAEITVTYGTNKTDVVKVTVTA